MSVFVGPSLCFASKVLRCIAGLVEMSEADKTNIDMVVEALHTKARTSTSTQRREKNYSGADWKWVQMHTYIENPYDRAVPVQVRVLSKLLCSIFCDRGRATNYREHVGAAGNNPLDQGRGD